MREHLRIALMALIGLACVPVPVQAAADCGALRLTNSIIMDPIEDNSPLRIPATIKGSTKSFAFELSGQIDLISGGNVSALGLKRQDANYLNAPQAGITDFVSIPEIVFGNAQAENMRFLVVDKIAPDRGIPYADVISRGVFRDSDIDLDFGARRLNFFSPDHCNGQVVYWPHKALAIVSIIREATDYNWPNGSIIIPITLDGHSFRAIIDTSASHTTMNLETAEFVFDYRPDAPAPLIPSSETVEYQHRFQSLSFDGVSIQNPLIGLHLWYPGRADPSLHYSLAAPVRTTDMVIGMDILRHLHIYVALGERKLYITEAGSGESALLAPHTRP